MKKCLWCDYYMSGCENKTNVNAETNCAEYKNDYIEHLKSLIGELATSLSGSNEALCDDCDEKNCYQCDGNTDRLLIKSALKIINI